MICDDMIRRFIELLLEIQPGMEADLAMQLEKQLRTEFKGERVYVKKSKPDPEEIVKKFDGRNVKEVARDLGISRDTVYRAIRQRREHQGRS